MRKILKTTTGRIVAAAFVAVIAVIGAVTVSNAAVKPDCKNLMYPLCARSVAAVQVVDNSLPGKTKLAPGSVDESRLDAGVKAKLNAPDQVGEDVKGGVEVIKGFPTKTITKMGGRYLDGFTPVGTFTLPKGKWMLTANVKFTRTVAAAAGDALARPQVTFRHGQDPATNSYGDDFGTIMGNDIAPALNADLTSSMTKEVEVSADTVVEVSAFGYMDDRGSAGSGQVTAYVEIYAARA